MITAVLPQVPQAKARRSKSISMKSVAVEHADAVGPHALRPVPRRRRAEPRGVVNDCRNCQRHPTRAVRVARHLYDALPLLQVEAWRAIYSTADEALRAAARPGLRAAQVQAAVESLLAGADTPHPAVERLREAGVLDAVTALTPASSRWSLTYDGPGGGPGASCYPAWRGTTGAG
jgi:hypothetical protein